MKKEIFTILALLFITSCVVAQQNIFHKVYGGATYSTSRVVLQCPDSSIVLVGSINSNDGNLNDFLFLKVDKQGNVLKEKKYGGEGIDFANWAVFNHDSTAIMIVGNTSSFTEQDYDIYVVYINLQGDTLWSKTIGGSGWDFGHHVLNTSDKEFLISGETYSFGAGNNDMYAVKIDTNGIVKWASTIGGLLQDDAKSAVEISDKRYVLVGSSKSFSAEYSNFYAACIDSVGDTVWTKNYNAPRDEYGTTNCLNYFFTDSLVVLGGYSSTEVSDTQKFYLIDYYGNLKRTNHSYASPDIGTSVIKEQPDGNGYYFVTQVKESYMVPYFVLYNYSFFWQNSRNFYTFRNSFVFNTTKLFDGGYVITGETESCGLLSSTSIFLYKINENLQTSMNENNLCNFNVNLELDIENYADKQILNVYPNPVTSNEMLTISMVDKEINRIEMYDLHGRKLNIFNDINQLQYQINTASLPVGMYFIHVQIGNDKLVKKIIVR